jgi:ATP-dependent 26S proteasome regulatory subunit
MIKDYLQLKTISHTSNTTEDPYKKSKATLIGDIHRVRRYFHSVTNTLEHIPDLDRRAVDAAIDEMRLTHDDDGNVLNNIHAYLTTVCLENTMTTEAEHKQQCQSWTEEQNQLCELNQERRAKADDLQKLRSKAEENVNSYAINLQNIIDEEKEVEVNAAKLILEASIMDTSNINGGWRSLHERAGKLKTDYQKKRHDAPVLLKNAQADLDKHTESYQELTTKIAEDDARIQDLDDFLKLNLTEEHRKLTVKYGRGLLLYGPPGTGIFS